VLGWGAYLPTMDVARARLVGCSDVVAASDRLAWRTLSAQLRCVCMLLAI
jgi:hypothetical protein